jgi:uroporphyrinogen decarboxylase
MGRPDRFLKACRRLPVDKVPVWLMRQAGRYMPEYRALRKDHSLLELVRDPDLAAEVTLQPVRAFDMDAAIIFSDILPVLEELGFDLSFAAGEGPVIANPIRSAADVDRCTHTPGRGRLEATCEAIRRVCRTLNGDLPLIGFAGAPHTLACYAVEGGSSRDFALARHFMQEEPAAWGKLLDLLSGVVSAYLQAQIEAGARAVQLFDSWIGILSPDAFGSTALPRIQSIFEALERFEVPRVYFGTNMAALLPLLHQTGADVIGIDWRVSLVHARNLYGPEIALQGNLDPTVLLEAPEKFCAEAKRILDSMVGQPGYIFNLGHGVIKETPPEHVQALVDFVHAYQR